MPDHQHSNSGLQDRAGLRVAPDDAVESITGLDLDLADDLADDLEGDPIEASEVDVDPPLVTLGMPTAAPQPGLVLVDGADEDDQWQERALCAQTDPEAFFPEKGGSTREAKRICLGCEVKDECLEYALANDERFGIWGGLSERERRRLKRGIV
ncbi:Transcriptional regulator WhiB2 [Rhodococcus sp. PBTS 1]|nr:Transcriptional regulator WhiB2 [Rhodococcus sp. PBTS 1]